MREIFLGKIFFYFKTLNKHFIEQVFVELKNRDSFVFSRPEILGVWNHLSREFAKIPLRILEELLSKILKNCTWKIRF